MKRSIAISLTLLFALVSWSALSAAQAAPGNSGAAHRCQKGGYLTLHRADGSGFRNSGECTSYAAHGGVFLEDSGGGGNVPLTNTSACTTFDDFANYTFDFGPGATTGLSSLSYTLDSTAPSSHAGEQAQGTITSGDTYASSTSGYPQSWVRSSGLTESPTGTYRFNMRLEVGLTPATLTVSDGTHTGTTTVPAGNSAPGCSSPA